MQKFVVKKSKSAPLVAVSSSSQQPSVQLKPTVIVCGTDKTGPPNASTATTTNAMELAKSNATANKSMPITAVTPSVTVSKATTATTTVASPPAVTISHVKMSGYLKKKRNKMGGWRKLWFVLQNQLLLSYSSKEDYEKKLAPFKDVLNLVPGTTVRPTKGPRFTIETSTNLIYTYRCDNNKECSEWITALVESLGLQTADHKHASSKLHYSMENLSKTRAAASSSAASSNSASPASSFMSSRSCDSIYRSQKAKINPKLPMAQSTARMLERAQNRQSARSAAAAKETTTIQAHNFRLHPSEAHVNQSFEVHQINRMFSSHPTTKVNLDRTISVCSNGNIGNSPRKTPRKKNSLRRHHHHRHHHHHHNHQQQHRIIEANEMPNDDGSGAAEHNEDLQLNNTNGNNRCCLDKNSNRHSITLMESQPTHRFDNGNCTLLEQMQRISLETDKNSNLHVTCVRKTSANSSIASPSLSCSSSMSSGSSGVSNASTASASKFQMLSVPKELPTSSGSGSSSITTNHNNTIHASLMMTTTTTTTTTPSNLVQTKNGEPIYAVVNLRDKYENRAKKKTLDEQLLGVDYIPRKERPNSFHVCSADYEEVLQLGGDCVDGCEDDENIYEPINIPELSSKGPLWRYFSKINIDTLVEMARWKKEQQQHQNGKEDTSTTFGDLRKRFGQHRKSIKNRMKKLYNRSSSCDADHDHKIPSIHLNGNGKDNTHHQHSNGHDTSGSSTSDSADKINRCHPSTKSEGLSAYFNKRDRHLFSSMLKKSRTSLTFDDVSRKKIISLAAIGGRTGVKNNKPTQHLNKNGCHSKFYD